MITSGQIRAARVFLRWTAEDLANESGIGVATIRRMELMDGLPTGNIRTLEALKQTLEKAGIEFIGDHSDRPGVRVLKEGK